MISVQVRYALRAAALLLFILAQVAVRAQSVTTLHSFDGYDDGAGDGAYPVAGLIQASDGNFYGTTTGGSTNGFGTVFRITPSGTLTTLHSFTGGWDGAYPTAGLIQASDGNFYGTTTGRSSNGSGTVFRITPSGTLTTLHSFTGGWDGNYPLAGLIQASDGNLYGTTAEGSANGVGTVFRITPSGTLTTLHSFDESDGYEPTASLIQASDGNLYGTTDYGGKNDFGTVFRMTLSGTLTTLFSFDRYDGAGDGALPYAGLIQASDGNLYGTTTLGGANDFGTVFRMTLSGTLTTVHSFDYFDGAYPEAGLIQASDGNLYGTTPDGGTNGFGTVYRVNLSQTSPIVLTERTVYTNLHPGTVSVVIWATNTGSKNEFNVTITAASLIGVNTSSVLPKNLRTIRPGETLAVVLSFPGLSVGQTGQLLVSGTSTEEHVSSPLTFFLNQAFTIP